jgi:radical SAM superfamily enzyme with C-terminal helix-hairpin-helix motif
LKKIDGCLSLSDINGTTSSDPLSHTQRSPCWAIVAELRCAYKEDALALATVKKWCKRFVEGRTSLCDNPRSGRSLSSDLAEAIASMLKEKPFAPCKVLRRHFRIGKTACLRILHDNLGMKKFNRR